LICFRGFSHRNEIVAIFHEVFRSIMSARIGYPKLLLTLPLLLFAFVALSLYLPIPASRLSSSEVESLRLVDRHGRLLREVLSTQAGRGRWVRLEQISPWVTKCLINTEDRRFHYHRGIDPFALLRATCQNISSLRIISGGSTLSQQLVRQVYDLPPQPLGKLVELWLALRLDRQPQQRRDSRAVPESRAVRESSSWHRGSEPNLLRQTGRASHTRRICISVGVAASAFGLRSLSTLSARARPAKARAAGPVAEWRDRFFAVCCGTQRIFARCHAAQ
jgi:hypothetical protein